MKPDPDVNSYLTQWAAIYDTLNYEKGMAAFFLKKSHAWLESRFDASQYFGRVLEVGAGTGVHLQFVRHAFDEYLMTDLNPPMLDKVNQGVSRPPEGRGKVIVCAENASLLSFPDKSFDRLIAAHILEHLYKPHEVLREWCRVLKPGGVLSLLLPCDPGLLWRLGQNISSRKKFERAGFDCDYWAAREHVNPINNLVTFVNYYFTDVKSSWFPMLIPSMDANLFYVAHITV
ncbi:MAG: class I SAM-dependent methyltransferase [Thermodesulfobacteriota bacterium]